MAELSKETLLKRAEEAFVNGEFWRALQTYGDLLTYDPDMDEAKVGVYLSDLGIENAEEALALFDYYQAIKDERPNAAEVIDELMRSMYVTKIKIEEFFKQTVQADIEEEGIRYQDFVKLIDERGGFKKALEDAMFSTKVIITQKEEFVDFIRRLIDAQMFETAAAYLDNTAKQFDNDQEILSLYELIRKAQR